MTPGVTGAFEAEGASEANVAVSNKRMESMSDTGASYPLPFGPHRAKPETDPSFSCPSGHTAGSESDAPILCRPKPDLFDPEIPCPKT